MVLDTRLKKIKYSWFTKLLCVVLSCVFAVSAIVSFLPLFYRWVITDGMLNIDKDVTMYDTSSFINYVRHDIYNLIEAAEVNTDKARYEADKKKCVDDIVAQFNEAKAEWKANNGIKIVEYHDYSEEVYYESQDFNHHGATVTDYNILLDFNKTAEQVEQLVEEQFEAYYYDWYVGNHDITEFELLKNVRYYAEAKDGTVVSNVESKENIVNEVFSEYVFLEDGKITYSENISKSAFPNTLTTDYFTTSTKVYYSLNPSFTGNDKYLKLKNAVDMTNGIDYTLTISIFLLSVVGMLLFLCLTVGLAGHKGDTLSLAFVDKIPCDLHLALSVFADFWVGFAAVGLAYIRHEQVLWNYEADFFVEEIAANPQLFMMVLAFIVVVFMLILTELLTSFARRIKTKSPIFRYTLLFFIIAAAFKLLKIIGKKIAGFFRKVSSSVRKWFKIIIFKPKKLNKGVAKLITGCTAINIIGFAVCCWCAFMSGWHNDEAWSIVAFFTTALILIFDAYVLYRLFKYMRSLDDIIDRAENHEPFDMAPEAFPISLQPLIRAYDETNSELQKAVIKAVRDERTKTELITNVSHDLKTPLTSVINYIDLLKQCDIEDEKALEYMNVIDEKSIKLKRLIEDLIEASKVSSGNVAINKTKLNLNELATQAIVEENAELEKHGLTLIFNEPENKVIVTADGTKIYRVIENLLSNVCKYSAHNSRVYASVYSQGGYGYFEIKNISSEPLNISAEELTERFVRGDASRNRDGNGLGLSIAKDLCTLNDGELTITIDGDLFKATVKLPK
ncbi:MAG: hypothetical protein IKT61_04060 [Clostridia bacterium]|nr:hypothetical protein [Clostridia bacterium]